MRQISHYSNVVHRQPLTDTESVMTKKTLVAIIAIVLGMLAVFTVIKIASAGYKFGQHLAQPKAQP